MPRPQRLLHDLPPGYLASGKIAKWLLSALIISSRFAGQAQPESMAGYHTAIPNTRPGVRLKVPLAMHGCAAAVAPSLHARYLSAAGPLIC
jgi:hypothetical protein